jgi:hypothetical protein
LPFSKDFAVDQKEAVERAIATAEKFASGELVDSAAYAAVRAADEARAAAAHAHAYAVRHSGYVFSKHSPARVVLSAQAYAAKAAAYAADAANAAIVHGDTAFSALAHVIFPGGPADAAAKAAETAVHFVSIYSKAAARHALEGTRVDFESLQAANLGSSGELGQPIDPSETGPLGPLWPNILTELVGRSFSGGSSDISYLAQENADRLIVEDLRRLAVFLDPGDAPSALITELYLSLDLLYRLQGGAGLRIANDECRSLSAEEVSL